LIAVINADSAIIALITSSIISFWDIFFFSSVYLHFDYIIYVHICQAFFEKFKNFSKKYKITFAFFIRLLAGVKEQDFSQAAIPPKKIKERKDNKGTGLSLFLIGVNIIESNAESRGEDVSGRKHTVTAFFDVLDCAAVYARHFRQAHNRYFLRLAYLFEIKHDGYSLFFNIKIMLISDKIIAMLDSTIQI
jgi:hypothetical protein